MPAYRQSYGLGEKRKNPGNDDSTVMTKVNSNARDHVVGTPSKFGPMQMMRDRMGQ
jgi:hypothetical protein